MGGFRLGKPDELVTDEWPQLVTYLDLETVSHALGTPLTLWLLQLDPADSGGFEGRQWTAAVMGPEVHAAYAFQWFALSPGSDNHLAVTGGSARTEDVTKIITMFIIAVIFGVIVVWGLFTLGSMMSAPLPPIVGLPIG